jgi:DNA-binding transcriptional MerR regulator
MTETTLAPSQVARATGVSTDTLRHYERLGLLSRVARTPAGYRRYSLPTVDRVLLIQRALVVGFSLNDLKRVLTIRDNGGVPCRGVRELVGRRLDSLEDRIQELMRLRDELRLLVKEWDATLSATPSGQPARLLETLGATVAIEQARHKRRRAVPTRR